MILRIITTVVLILFIAFFPYWIYLPLILVALIYFRFYWEGIFLSVLIDILYAPNFETGLLSSPYALSALVILLILVPIKDRLRFNA